MLARVSTVPTRGCEVLDVRYDCRVAQFLPSPLGCAALIEGSPGQLSGSGKTGELSRWRGIVQIPRLVKRRSTQRM